MSSDEEKGFDEKRTYESDISPERKESQVLRYNNTVVTQDNGFLSKLRRMEARLDAKLGVESEAIVRKLPEEKKPVPWHQQLNMALLWASGTMNTSCFATGFLGWEFGLSLKQTILITIFASILGGAVTGFAATFGAATGLRQISVSRYCFGWYPNKIIAFLNTVVQIGGLYHWWSGSDCSR